MTNWNFFCAKGFNLKALIVFTFFCLQSKAQIEALNLSKYSVHRISEKVDSLSNYFSIPIHSFIEEFSQDIELNTTNTPLRTESSGNCFFLLNLETLKTGDSLFISDGTRKYVYSQIIGNKIFWSHNFNGTIEITSNNPLNISVDAIAYSNIKTYSPTEDFGDSDFCQVNSNCSESFNFSDEKKSAIRILVRVGSGLGWCSGSLISTVDRSYKPYILTAEHCAYFGSTFASSSDFLQWNFYFNYESPDCNNPSEEGNLAQQFIVGSELISRSDDNGGDTGPDFLLLELAESIPEDFHAFYAGWNRSGDISTSGVCFHHPEGDIKKISTYNSNLVSESFGQVIADTHWEVQWDGSINGYGVTEGGSSGSALLDQNGLVLGFLTGGLSGCSNLRGEDYYGKLSLAWFNNSSMPSFQLQPWLDPNSTNVEFNLGSYYGDSIVPEILDFSLSPNPTTNNISVEGIGNISNQVDIIITDQFGSIVYSDNLNPIGSESTEIITQNLRAGLYILMIGIDDEFQFHKFIKL